MYSLTEWAKALPVFGGVIVGIFAVFAPSWVWFRKQVLSWAAFLLSLCGMILIIASLFSSITVSATRTGLEVKLTAIEAQLKQLSASLDETKGTVQNVQVALRNIPTGQVANIAKDLDFVNMRLEQIEKASQTQLNELQSATTRWDRKFESISDAISSLASAEGRDRSNKRVPENGSSDIKPQPMPFKRLDR